MMPDTRSPLARQVPGVRDPNLGVVRIPWGLLIHTTGGGITDAAKKHGMKPIDIAVHEYIHSQNGSNGYLWGGPHYVIDLDGTLYQLAPDIVMTAHCGGANRKRYFDGTWEAVFPLATHFWQQKWGPRFKHPYQLFPSTSPNHDFVGVEMIPCGDGFGTPMRPGLRFSTEQHETVIALAKEMSVRHGWPAGWQNGTRFVGHEDVDPLNRADQGGGWDPGFLRAAPYFDFAYVRGKAA